MINNGNKIAIQAIADAKHASYVISNYLNGKEVSYVPDYHVVRKDVTRKELLKTHTLADSAKMDHLTPGERRDNFHEIAAGYTEEQAQYEGDRCLECGCMDYFECDLFDQFNQYDVVPERFAGKMSAFDHDNNHPYILIDPNKCVLCGMCVRVCDEVMGVYALGLADRGFESRMMPAAERRLQDTACISCGQCVELCPVGALQERRPVHKQVPLDSEYTLTTCAGCSLGCSQILESTGNMLLRALPVENCEVSGGLLCVKGRFELDRFLLAKEDRLERPLVRRDGEFEETSYDEAILSFTRGAQSLLAVEGADKLAVSVSDEYTLEETALIRSFAESLLENTKLYSLNYKKSALEEVLGSDSSPNTFNEIFLTDLVIVVGGDLLNTHPMLATKIRRANKEGVRLGIINTHDTLMDKWTPDKVKGDKLADLLQSFCESESDLAQSYRETRRAILVYDKDALSYEEEIKLIELAQKSGHFGSPGNGVIQVKANANSQGLYDLGVRGSREELLKSIDTGQVKGLLVFGDSDLPEEYAAKLSFLAVQATKYTPAFTHADVILPGSCLAEKEGLITSSEGRVQALEPVIATDAGSFDQLRYFWHHFDRSDDDIDLQTAREAVVFYNQAYQAILDPENMDIWVRPLEAKIKLED